MKKQIINYQFETKSDKEFDKLAMKNNSNFTFSVQRATLEIIKTKNYIYDFYTDSNASYPNSFHKKYQYDECGNLVKMMKWKNSELLDYFENQYLELKLISKKTNLLTNRITEYIYNEEGKILKEVEKNSFKEF